MILVLQVLIEAKQNKPLEDVQTLVPHAQLSELTAVPSSTEHSAYGLQVCIEDVQNKPVESEQILVPHIHVDGFVEAPTSFAHAIPVQQAHERSVVQGPVFNAGSKKSWLPGLLAGLK